MPVLVASKAAHKEEVARLQVHPPLTSTGLRQLAGHDALTPGYTDRRRRVGVAKDDPGRCQLVQDRCPNDGIAPEMLCEAKRQPEVPSTP